jgi:hypothetical protein
MPDRRARMLNVEETPVVTVPVVAPSNWLREKEPSPEPVRARFLSEAEEAATINADNGFFFAAAAPGVATTVKVAGPESSSAADLGMDFGMKRESQVSAPRDVAPQEAEAKTQGKDAAAGSAEAPRTGEEAEAAATPAEPGLFPEAAAEKELDVPTFMRRTKF